MSTLPTNYVDAVLNAEVNTRRKFNLIDNGDGTVSLEDVTDYTTEGSNYGATDINNQNAEINQINTNLTELESEVNKMGSPIFDFNHYKHIFQSSAPSDLPAGATYGTTYTSDGDHYLWIARVGYDASGGSNYVTIDNRTVSSGAYSTVYQANLLQQAYTGPIRIAEGSVVKAVGNVTAYIVDDIS